VDTQRQEKRNDKNPGCAALHQVPHRRSKIGRRAIEKCRFRQSESRTLRDGRSHGADTAIRLF
jgi:hypothetical protein